MHIRKQRILEYLLQNEAPQTSNGYPEQTQLTQNIFEPKITIEYPTSPSSINSDDDKTPEKIFLNITNYLNIFDQYSIEDMQVMAKDAITSLNRENLSPKNLKDAQNLVQIATSLGALEKYSNNSNIQLAEHVTQLVHDPKALLHVNQNLKELIEEYIINEMTNSSLNSITILKLVLAKLNQLRVNALLKPKEQLITPASSQEEHNDELPQDLSIAASLVTTNQTNDVAMHIDDVESKPVINEDTLKNPSEISINSKSLVDRVSEIFTFINQTQLMFEQLPNFVVMSNEKKNKKTPKNSNKSSSASATSAASSTSATNESIPSTSKFIARDNFKKNSNIENQNPNSFVGNIYPLLCPYDSTKVIIGPNGSKIPKVEWDQLDWNSKPAALTRKLIVHLFDRDTLATSSLTGRPSPAFIELNYPEKNALDANIVQDVVDLITSRTIATPKEVRMAITTKCADETKLRRAREAKIAKNAQQNGVFRIKPY